MKIEAVDVFCGAGGLTIGLLEAGVQVLAGFDADPACQIPYTHNTGAKFILSDIRNLSCDSLRAYFSQDTIKLIAGCAPCQPFSTYAARYRKNLSDERWSLLREFLRLVEGIKPELVTMENVTGLSKHPVFDEFIRTLRKIGYYISMSDVDCVKLGVPQKRRRLVLAASRVGYLEIAFQTEPVQTVRDVIGGLPEINAGCQDLLDPLHVASRLSSKNIERVKVSKPGGTWRDWPERLIAPCHKRDSGMTYPGVYGRMEWDNPAPTITTQFYGFGNGRFGHPEQDRALTLREGALLQTFPPSSIFTNNDGKIHFKTVGRLIGNAVPPVLGKAIGKLFEKHIREEV